MNRGYRPEIDGLRALAVLSVVAYHLDEDILGGGFLGVDVFLVISGYVITRSMLVRKATSLGPYLASFYARRIKRLLPALLSSVVLTSAAAWLLHPEPAVSLATGAISLFGLSNIYLYIQATDYFSQPSQLNPFKHTWSLGVEEQFYLIYPFLLWSFRAKGCETKLNRQRLARAVTLLSISSLAAYAIVRDTHPMGAFFLIPTRFWELGTGCLLALREEEPTANETPSSWSLITLAFIVLAATLAAPAITQLAVISTVVCVASTAMLIRLMARQSIVRSVFASPPLVYIGRLSYSLYLWHWPVVSASRWLVDFSGVTISAMLLLSLGLAMASYHLIERPLRYARWSSRDGRTIAYGMTASGIVASALALTVAQTPGDAARNGWPGLSIIHYSLGCHLPAVADPVEHCLTRNSDLPTVFVVGDSHASNLVPSLSAAFDSEQWDLVYLGDRTRRAFLFPNLREKSNFLATQLRPGDIVMFSLSRSRVYGKRGYRGVSRRGKQSNAILADLRSGLSALLEVAQTRNARLVLVDDIPLLCGREDFIVYRATRRLGECSSSRRVSRDDREPLSELYRSIVEPVDYLDPHDSLCEAETCKPLRDGKPLYGDGAAHFSNFHPAPLREFFKRWFSGAN